MEIEKSEIAKVIKGITNKGKYDKARKLNKIDK